MEYNSFYGGRRGASFVIVKSYKTIKAPAEDNLGFNKIIRMDLGLAEDAEISTENREKWLADNCMVYCFSQGGAYKTVNYDEYVIIDTYNKNDIDNGKIYRRGYDYTNVENGGAVYIGQIVGPAGMAPHTELKEYDAVEKMVTEDGLYYIEDENGNRIEISAEDFPMDGTTVYDGNLNQYRKTQATLDTATEDLLPGHYFNEAGEDSFNDTIEYIACSIRDFESHESTVHIGFKIPYHVVRYTAESVSPYYHRTDDEKYQNGDIGKGKPWEGWSEQGETTDFNNAELIERTDDMTHPFFSQWHISIPKGIKGETFKNFRITTAAEVDGLDIKFDENNNAPADYRETSDTYKKQILVYDYYNYDRDVGGDPVSIYLGDYNMIEGFRIDDDGTIIIDYSHEHRDYYANYLKAVDTIQINPETGLLQIDYNYDQQYERDENGDFILDVEGNKIPIPDTATHYETYLQYIKDITLDENGTMIFYYSYNDEENLDNEDPVQNTLTVPNKLRWINSIAIDTKQDGDNEGHLTVVYNTKRGDTGTINEEGLDTFETDLKWVNNIILNDNGTLTLKYSGKGESVIADETLIQWIKEIELNTESGHLIITYNTLDDNDKNNTYETDLTWLKNFNLADDGTITLTYTTKEEVLEKKVKWINNIRIDTGDVEGEGSQKLMVTYNNDTTQEIAIGNPINYIMRNVIAIPPTQEQIDAGFLYDATYAYHALVLYSDPLHRGEVLYDDRTDWVDLGYIGQGTLGAVVGKESDETVQNLAAELPPYSAWFVIEEE